MDNLNYKHHTLAEIKSLYFKGVYFNVICIMYMVLVFLHLCLLAFKPEAVPVSPSFSICFVLAAASVFGVVKKTAWSGYAALPVLLITILNYPVIIKLFIAVMLVEFISVKVFIGPSRYTLPLLKEDLQALKESPQSNLSVDINNNAEEGHCPNCNNVVKEGNVICINCGLNLKTGKHISSQNEDESKDEYKNANLYLYIGGRVIRSLAVLGIGIIVSNFGSFVSSYDDPAKTVQRDYKKAVKVLSNNSKDVFESPKEHMTYTDKEIKGINIKSNKYIHKKIPKYIKSSEMYKMIKNAYSDEVLKDYSIEIQPQITQFYHKEYKALMFTMKYSTAIKYKGNNCSYKIYKIQEDRSRDKAYQELLNNVSAILDKTGEIIIKRNPDKNDKLLEYLNKHYAKNELLEWDYGFKLYTRLCKDPKMYAQVLEYIVSSKKEVSKEGIKEIFKGLGPSGIKLIPEEQIDLYFKIGEKDVQDYLLSRYYYKKDDVSDDIYGIIVDRIKADKSPGSTINYLLKIPPHQKYAEELVNILIKRTDDNINFNKDSSIFQLLCKYPGDICSPILSNHIVKADDKEMKIVNSYLYLKESGRQLLKDFPFTIEALKKIEACPDINVTKGSLVRCLKDLKPYQGDINQAADLILEALKSDDVKYFSDCVKAATYLDSKKYYPQIIEHIKRKHWDYILSFRPEYTNNSEAYRKFRDLRYNNLRRHKEYFRHDKVAEEYLQIRMEFINYLTDWHGWDKDLYELWAKFASLGKPMVKKEDIATLYPFAIKALHQDGTTDKVKLHSALIVLTHKPDNDKAKDVLKHMIYNTETGNKYAKLWTRIDVNLYDIFYTYELSDNQMAIIEALKDYGINKAGHSSRSRIEEWLVIHFDKKYIKRLKVEQDLEKMREKLHAETVKSWSNFTQN